MGGAGTGTLDVSLAEVEALCRKAARGRGYPWGLAEEAGRAARELAADGREGPAALLALLDASGGDVGEHSPVPGTDGWVAAGGGWACPIATATALSDRAHRLDVPVTVARVLVPLLMAPSLRRASLGFDGGCPALDGVPHDVRIGRVTGADPGAGRPAVTLATWRALERWAHRTYVPASAASRAGAGASGGED